ncbi:MAG: hypothetical protein QM811_17440 [Pirellulales bacterium]
MNIVAPSAENIGANIDDFADSLFGGHVVERSPPVGPAVFDRFGQTEVQDFHGAADRQQQIRGFDVAMNETAFVRIFQAQRRLTTDFRHGHGG